MIAPSDFLQDDDAVLLFFPRLDGNDPGRDTFTFSLFDVKFLRRDSCNIAFFRIRTDEIDTDCFLLGRSLARSRGVF